MNTDNLFAVFQRLQNGLQKEKCSFCQQSIQYLGYIVDSAGIRVSEERINAIQMMGAPKDQSELRSFLGMVNYFGNFFPSMSTYTVP